ncbi:MAG: PH domain-containing protein [Candidatus Micrarchaeota archaeon]|nr:PH domain-containing protein [Candidatus Micrarchaeota archaeon]MCX8154657.1 PH domain-containing protein [Candidatus Micrarchaeota archaeon]
MRFYFSYFYEFLKNGLLISIIGLILLMLPEIVQALSVNLPFDFLYFEENFLVLRGVGILLILFAFIYSYLKFKFSFLDITPEYLYYEEGIIAKVRKKIPYKTITDIQMKRSVLDTIMGWDSIYINTAGRADYELIIKGISIEHGDLMFEELKKRISASNLSRE